MGLHVLGCPEHDLTFSEKCLSVCVSVCVCARAWVRLCVCDKNFVASVAREVMHKISWNFIFCDILT